MMCHVPGSRTVRAAMRAAAALLCAVCGALPQRAAADVYYRESFDPNSHDAWTAAPGSGRVRRAHGRYYGDSAAYVGLQTAEDARFYTLSAPLTKVFDNGGRDLVVSFTVQHSQDLDCGGGYIKLLPATAPDEFSSSSPYYMMFGPDICGHKKEVHLIFGHRGRPLHWKKRVVAPADVLTHAYTAVVRADNTYEVFIDGESKAAGSLEDDWDFLAPKTIDDPTDVKPADWVDAAEIPDPTDTKPADLDESQPEYVPDLHAQPPDDWDGDEDEWETPLIRNPLYHRWTPRMIPNPAYKGPYKHRQVPNPEYQADPELYRAPYALAAVGIDVWQVKSGTVFDNIIVADDVVAVETWVWRNLFAYRHEERDHLAAEMQRGKDAAKAWRDTEHPDHHHYDDGYEYAD